MAARDKTVDALEGERRRLADEVSRLRIAKDTATQELEQAKREAESGLRPLRESSAQLGRELQERRAEIAQVQQIVHRLGVGVQAQEQALERARSAEERSRRATLDLEARALEATRQIERADALAAELQRLEEEHKALVSRIAAAQETVDQTMATLAQAEERIRAADAHADQVHAELGVRERALRDREVLLQEVVEGQNRRENRLSLDAAEIRNQQGMLAEQERVLERERERLREVDRQTTMTAEGYKTRNAELIERAAQLDRKEQVVTSRLEGVKRQLADLEAREHAHAQRVHAANLEHESLQRREQDLQDLESRLKTVKAQYEEQRQGLLRAAEEITAREQAVRAREQRFAVEGK